MSEKYKFLVDGTNLSCLGCVEVPSENVNVLLCEFKFAGNSGLKHWFCSFRKAGKVRNVEIENGACEFADEMLTKEGKLFIGVFGSNLENGAGFKRISTNFVQIDVGRGAFQGAVGKISPTLWEKYAGEVEECKERIAANEGDIADNEKAIETAYANLTKHTNTTPLDHPNGSVTYSKLDYGVQNLMFKGTVNPPSESDYLNSASADGIYHIQDDYNVGTGSGILIVQAWENYDGSTFGLVGMSQAWIRSNGIVMTREAETIIDNEVTGWSEWTEQYLPSDTPVFKGRINASSSAAYDALNTIDSDGIYQTYTMDYTHNKTVSEGILIVSAALYPEGGLAYVRQVMIDWLGTIKCRESLKKDDQAVTEWSEWTSQYGAEADVAALKDKIGKLGEIEKGDGENSIQQRSNRATASNAAALNAYTRAAGINALSTGEQTVASGKNSNTEGYLTFTFGEQSHAQNCRTIAGIRGFNILSVEVNLDAPYSLIYLDSVEGIEVSDTVSWIAQNGVNVNVAVVNYVDAANNALEIPTEKASQCILYKDETGAVVKGQAVNTLFIARKSWLGTKVMGHHNHAEGFRTVATGDAQHVEGKCNIIDTKNEFAHIVGNGTGEAQRSNAYTLDWKGNAEFAGSITAKGAKINGAIESPTIDELYRKNDANESEILKNTGLIESGQIIVSEEGQSINLKDASDMNMKGLNIFGKTNQAGSPSPENPSELSNIAPDGNVSLNLSGKNLIPYPYKQLDDGYVSGDITITDNGDGTVAFNGTTTATRYVRLIWNTELFELPAGEYTLSGCPAGGGKNTYQVAVSKTVDNVRTVVGYDKGAGFTFTHDGEGTIDIIISLYTSVTYNKLTFKPMLERGTAATDFEPYKEQSMTVSTPNGLPGVPVNSGGNYTDADGQQWVCDEIDLERGVYIQRVYTTTIAGFWDIHTVTNYQGTVFYEGLLMGLPAAAGGGLCETATYTEWTDIYPTTENTFTLFEADYGSDLSVVALAEGTTDEFLAKFAGKQFMFIRKTPIEIPLSEEEISAYKELHTYKPVTNIFNDAGAHMAVKYVADPKTYIDNKFAELQTAILSIAE